jgi:hypothetical protein
MPGTNASALFHGDRLNVIEKCDVLQKEARLRGMEISKGKLGEERLKNKCSGSVIFFNLARILSLL